MEDLFYNLTIGGKISLDKVAEDIYTYIKEDEHSEYEIFVGSDSQVEKRKTCFVTSICVLRTGNGGKFYTHKWVILQKMGMRQRIWSEATYSIETFNKLIDKLTDLGILDIESKVEYDKIHLDAGLNGKSREIINEVSGMIIANGFKAVVKPQAFAAQCIANKFTKKF
jgi:predicted RNase H-related nuclease YkuK (DUF458 family)